MRWTLVVSLAAACSGNKDSGPGATDATGGTGDTGTTDTQDTDTDDPTIDASATLLGTITTEGAPVEDAVLRLCRAGSCRNGSSDASGAYRYDAVVVTTFSFEAAPPEGTSGLATAFAPLEFQTDQERVVDVDLLPLDPASPLGASPAELPAGAGLHLTLAQDDLEPPLFMDPATELAGVAVPEGQRVPVDGVTGTVIGMWYVGPFDHHAVAASGIPARFENTWALADGTNLRCYVGSYSESVWRECGALTVTGGEITGEAGLPLLSTVILVQE